MPAWAIMPQSVTPAAAYALKGDHPALTEKLRRASPHWMRHSHASHALMHVAELTSVRDNLRHAAIATTSTYLRDDDVKRARQMTGALGPRKIARRLG